MNPRFCCFHFPIQILLHFSFLADPLIASRWLCSSRRRVVFKLATLQTPGAVEQSFQRPQLGKITSTLAGSTMSNPADSAEASPLHLLASSLNRSLCFGSSLPATATEMANNVNNNAVSSSGGSSIVESGSTSASAAERASRPNPFSTCAFGLPRVASGVAFGQPGFSFSREGSATVRKQHHKKDPV